VRRYSRRICVDPRAAVGDGGPKQPVTGVQNTGGRGSTADSLMNTENTEGAANGARTCYEDRQERNFQDLLVARPLKDPSQVDRARDA
jgi:hypothetical protein